MSGTLVIGGSGLLGSRLIELLTAAGESVSATYFSNEIAHKGCKMLQLDIGDKRKVDEVIGTLKPHTVINASGERNTRYCERNPDEAYRVNVEGTENVVRACKAVGARMVFISSDLVFDGTKGTYREEDEVNPLSVYGKQKVMAEKIIRDGLDSWLILRASSIYGWNPRRDNFVSWVLQELKKGQEIDIVYDQYITPIYAKSLANMVMELLERDKSGVYHVGDGTCLSKYEFVRKIAEVFGFDEKLVKPISSDELSQSIKMPKNNCLDLTKIRSELDFSRYSLTAGLEALKREALLANGV